MLINIISWKWTNNQLISNFFSFFLASCPCMVRKGQCLYSRAGKPHTEKGDEG